MAAQKRLNKRRVTFYMSDATKDWLEKYADETGLKQSYLVEQAVEEYRARAERGKHRRRSRNGKDGGSLQAGR